MLSEMIQRSMPSILAAGSARSIRWLIMCCLPIWCGGCYRNVFGSEYETCADVDAAIKDELASLQSCTANADCGLILEGTSCGCTNELVGRKGFDDARLRSLYLRADELQCTEAATECSCPKADGFVCTEGVCGWNYVP